LGRSIEGVSAAEEEDPTRWMAPGSLLLTSGMILRDHPEMGAALVARLSEEGMSALGLAMAPYWTEVPESMVAAADELGFPLLRISGGIPFHAITQYVFTAQYPGDLYALRRSVSLQSSLAELLTHHDGIHDLIRRLSDFLTADVFLFDWHGEVLESSRGGNSRKASQERSHGLWLDYEAHVKSASRLSFFHSGSAQVSFREVRMQGGLERLLMIILPDAYVLDEFTEAAIGFATTLLEVDVLANHNVLGRLRRARAAFLDELLLSGERVSDVSERLAHHGISVAEPWRLVAVSARTGDGDQRRLPRAGNSFGDEGIGLVDSYLESFGVRFLSTWRSDCLIVLLGLSLEGQPIDARQFALGLVQQVARDLHMPDLRAGLSESVTGVTAVAEALTHARQALLSAQRNSNLVVAYEDLGLHFAALNALPDGQLEALHERIVMPLLETDRADGTHLHETLLAYLAHDRSLVETARALYLHRNTLSHRLDRVEKVLGVDLTGTDDLLDICLATKASEVLELRRGLPLPVSSESSAS
jgi:purine catabolism regulator